MSADVLLQYRSACLLNFAMLLTRNRGLATMPTPKSDKARLTSSKFDGKCKEGVLQIEKITKRFATVAVREVRTVSMQLII